MSSNSTKMIFNTNLPDYIFHSFHTDAKKALKDIAYHITTKEVKYQLTQRIDQLNKRKKTKNVDVFKHYF